MTDPWLAQHWLLCKCMELIVVGFVLFVLVVMFTLGLLLLMLLVDLLRPSNVVLLFSRRRPRYPRH